MRARLRNGCTLQVAAAREEKMRKVLSALAVLASSSGVSSERETFLQLVSIGDHAGRKRVVRSVPGRTATACAFVL